MRDQLLGRLREPQRSGLYRVSRAENLMQALQGSELAFATVDLAQPVWDAFSRALAFPDWFGRNWDALEDCLTDLSWREAPGHVLLMHHAARLGGPERRMLEEVLRAAAEFWAAEGKSFFAVFVDPGSELPYDALSCGA